MTVRSSIRQPVSIGFMKRVCDIITTRGCSPLASYFHVIISSNMSFSCSRLNNEMNAERVKPIQHGCLKTQSAVLERKYPPVKHRVLARMKWTIPSHSWPSGVESFVWDNNQEQQPIQSGGGQQTGVDNTVDNEKAKHPGRVSHTVIWNMTLSLSKVISMSFNLWFLVKLIYLF